MNGGTERRRHVRVGFSTAVTYLVEAATTENVGNSDNVGGGGMRLATHEPIAVRSVLLLRFSLPSSAVELLARGRIVMSFYEAASKQYKHGIAFTQFEPSGTDELMSFLTRELERTALAGKKATGE